MLPNCVGYIAPSTCVLTWLEVLCRATGIVDEMYEGTPCKAHNGGGSHNCANCSWRGYNYKEKDNA